ncbi:MAG: DUF2007 domain-containing protein [Paludibacteraceae bacterium]|nr:DUF2007 domain-containing protein [Paludibacteraceae bacterium]
MDERITVRTFSSSVDFEMVKAYLESYGIECFGKDEFTNRAYLANVDGGVKLQVAATQLDEAVKLLIEGGYIKPEDMESSAELQWAEKIINKIKAIFQK